MEVFVETVTVRVFEVVFENGVFKPLQDPGLKEGQRGIMVRQESQDASPEDPVVYKLYLLEQIDAGLEDANAGRTWSVEEVRARFGLE